jgi:alginate O-acetyltransferase complex protein AlgI
MLFNNPFFFLFLIAVYVLYWAVAHRAQNILLLVASYVFYACWDWRFLGLLFGVSAVAYLGGLALERTNGGPIRRVILIAALVLNLGCLGVFKYYNFFANSLAALIESAGLGAPDWTLQIVLPVGISFFVFQAVSYVFDVYRRDIDATRHPIEFMTYIAFFPQLVAGPIERAQHMLPQFAAPRHFDVARATEGAGFIIWGLFKKAVIADRLAVYVDMAFVDVGASSGFSLLLATYCFAIQIYCDFSGYSDIALGCGRLLGLDLTQNFRHPYFSRSPGEFWSRWHVTLSTWFRDYVYIPLGGSRCNATRYTFNILAVFSISGLWHGANWTYVVWGFLNGVLILAFRWMEPSRAARGAVPGGDGILPRFASLWRMVLTFHLILLTWLFFRADSISDAWIALGKVITFPVGMSLAPLATYALPMAFSGVFVLTEWLTRSRFCVLSSRVPRQFTIIAARAAVVCVIVWFGQFAHVPFIYFQF